MSGYLKQKLFEALHDLLGSGEIDQRLTYAAMYFAHLKDADIPDQYRKEISEIKAIMFVTALSSTQSYTPRQISEDEAVKLARRILSLYTDVMGGL